MRWALTELDMPCSSEDSLNEQFCFANQAQAFGSAVKACLESPACDTVVQWGVGDRYTWWNGVPGGQFVNPLVLNPDFEYKPAAEAVVRALQ